MKGTHTTIHLEVRNQQQKTGIFYMKNANTECVCCSDLKFDGFTKDYFTLIISNYELWYVTQILHIKRVKLILSL